TQVSLAQVGNVSAHSLNAAQRLAIYSQSLTTALIHTLANTYPICQQLVGIEFFTAMAKLYVQQTPSYSPDINDYGETFAEFIKTFSPAASLPYLTDMAMLEWAWHSALRSEEEMPGDISQLQQLMPEQYEQVKFRLPKGSTLLSSEFPLLKI